MNDETTELNPLDALVEEFSSKLRSGSAPSVEDFAREHPKQAGELRDLLPAVVAMEQLKQRRRSGQPIHAPAMPDHIGDFQIVRELGRGGMGIVYEALERTLNRRVALKILPGHAVLSGVRLERFKREAQTAAQLHHTNIVPVFGIGEAEGLHYFVMQFIEGRTLHEVVGKEIGDRRQEIGVRNQESGVRNQESEKQTTRSLAESPNSYLLSPNSYWCWSARVTQQVAEALTYAHAHGVVHRDIKPANILIDPSGTAWVTDFGLAKLGDQDGLTRSGDILGTLQYLAPESFNGTSDARGDIYSLGLTLYEVLTRRPPYSETTTAGLIKEISMHEPIRPRKLDPRIPRDLETIVLKASARAPEQRYQSAAELAEDLRCFLEDRPIRARNAGPIERTVRWCRRNRAVAALGGIAAAAVVLAGVAGWVGYSQTSAALGRVAKEAQAARLAEQRADANVEMSLQALEEMFEQLNSSDTQDNGRVFQITFPMFGNDNSGRQGGLAGLSNLVGQNVAIQGEKAGDKNPPPPNDKNPGPPHNDRPQIEPRPQGGGPDDHNSGGGGGAGGRRGFVGGFAMQPGFRRGSTENVELVQSILTFYERFAEKNATNTKLRLESARAYERVGELQWRLRQNEKAEQAFHKTIAIAEELGAQLPNSTELRLVSAKAQARLGELAYERKDYDAAGEAYVKAIAELEPLAAADRRQRAELSQVRLWYVESLKQQKKYEQAIAVAQSALASTDVGENPMRNIEAGWAYRRLAELYELSGDPKASSEALKKADEFGPRGRGPRQ
ncbi:MAG TPA: protein kinase [Planctomycetota bacterium]|nr:protein kinase [Planctomycetota bacterium]